MEGSSSQQQCGTSEWYVRASAMTHCNVVLREQVGGLQWHLLWQVRALLFCQHAGAVSSEGSGWTFDKCLTCSFFEMLFLTGVNVHFLIGVYIFLHWRLNLFLHIQHRQNTVFCLWTSIAGSDHNVRTCLIAKSESKSNFALEYKC